MVVFQPLTVARDELNTVCVVRKEKLHQSSKI